jgi:hypothetical protein
MLIASSHGYYKALIWPGGRKKENIRTQVSLYFLMFSILQCLVYYTHNTKSNDKGAPSESACNIVGISSIPEKFLCKTFVFCCIIYLFVSPFRQYKTKDNKWTRKQGKKKKKRRTWYVPTYSFPSLFWSSSLLLYRFHFISLASIHSSSSYECVQRTV